MIISESYFALSLTDSYRKSLRKKFKTHKEVVNAIREDKHCLKLKGFNLNKKHKTEKAALAQLERVQGYEPDMFQVDEMLDIGF